jgi:cytochrome c
MDLVVSSGRNGSKKLDRDWIGPALPHLRPARLRVPFPAIAAALALVCVAVWCAVVIDAAQAGRTIWSGIYSEAQARRGEEAYKLECAYCHQPDLSGGFFDNGTGRAPALAGPKAFDSSFVDRWRDQTVGEFIATIAATMPQPKPASLPVQTYIDIATFVMSKNGIPAGPADLPADVQAMQQIAIVAKP